MPAPTTQTSAFGSSASGPKEGTDAEAIHTDTLCAPLPSISVLSGRGPGMHPSVGLGPGYGSTRPPSLDPGVFPGSATSACLSCETIVLGVAFGASFADGWGTWAASEPQTARTMTRGATPTVAQRGLSMAETPPGVLLIVMIA